MNNKTPKIFNTNKTGRIHQEYTQKNNASNVRYNVLNNRSNNLNQ